MRAVFGQAALLLLVASHAGAQLDPSRGWRTLHTPHFRIHFRPAARAAAQVEAREAERAYALLARELHPPRGVVDLVLSDDADVGNGYATPFPSNRIVIYLPPPAKDVGLGGYDRWQRLATTHELTHIFHLDRVRSFWGVLQHVFGRAPGLFPNDYQPTWVVEGLAVYYESKLTHGGRVRGSFHTEVMASDALAKHSRAPSNALLFTRWSDGYAPYAYGSRFLRYLADSLGDSVIPRFTETTAGQLIPFRVGRDLARAVPGLSLRAAWPRATRPPPALLPAGAEPSTVLEQRLWTEPVPRVSPDGRRVAFVWDDGKGALQLRIVALDGWRALRSHRVNGQVSYDWLGDTLLVSQADLTSRRHVRNDLYRWLPDGRWERMTSGARLEEPRGGGDVLSAIRLVPGGNRPTVLERDSTPEPGVTWGDVAPSPDGRWIAATRNADGYWTLVRWPRDAPRAREVLLSSSHIVSDPAWTPEGRLLFVGDHTGHSQVYRWDEGVGPVALSAEPLGARAPAALRDGTLLYCSLGDGGWELRRARPAPRLSGPVPAPLPLDSAPEVPIRETGYALLPSLRPHFWLPFFLDESSAGRFFGVATGGTDVLERYAYVAAAYASGSPARAGGAFAVTSDLFANPSLDFSWSSDWSQAARVGGFVVSESDRDAALGATFVLPRWRRTATLRVAAEYEGMHFAVLPDSVASPAAFCAGCVDRGLVGGSVTLGLRYGVTSILAVSPEDGFEWSLLYRRREEQGSARWSNEVRARLALYLHVPGIGGFAHHVVALRMVVGGLAGSVPKLLDVGGVANGAVAVGFGQALGGDSRFPVRGYETAEVSGRRAAAVSLEYRIPLALIGESIGHLPFGADKLSLSLFGDAGNAWAAGGAPRLTRLASVGAELVGDMTFNYDRPLRLRLGVAQPLALPPSGATRRPVGYLAVSSEF